ncbi:hypothetical protein TRFO_07564 [Tritrichomonas foetus]|uniref:Myb-like DNA-binding domain containing protein n=1 Tax=Tritrichomonas foetus TaxID=1144522 RepID=A0A1J4JSD8_9EUKA|nr:hypothetical protein TRFO_07564 [Tritrichomonas foetus]|eukprot:OHT01336.1 hypothetical protein TRFO_07564 [Tritrichomonas foetus]
MIQNIPFPIINSLPNPNIIIHHQPQNIVYPPNSTRSLGGNFAEIPQLLNPKKTINTSVAPNILKVPCSQSVPVQHYYPNNAIISSITQPCINSLPQTSVFISAESTLSFGTNPNHPQSQLNPSFDLSNMPQNYETIESITKSSIQKVNDIPNNGVSSDNYSLQSSNKTNNDSTPTRRKTNPWTISEDTKLIKSINLYGENWEKVTKEFEGKRTRSQCIQRWYRVLNPNISKVHWTSEEDEKLIKTVEKYGEACWTRASAILGNRSDVQCRYRYKQLMKLMEKSNKKDSQLKNQVIDEKIEALSQMLDDKNSSPIESNVESEERSMSIKDEMKMILPPITHLLTQEVKRY